MMIPPYPPSEPHTLVGHVIRTHVVMTGCAASRGVFFTVARAATATLGGPVKSRQKSARITRASTTRFVNRARRRIKDLFVIASTVFMGAGVNMDVRKSFQI